MKASFIPLIVFALVVLLAAVPLLAGKDPSVLPSALLERPAPGFDLPPALDGKGGFATADLKKGAVSVVNVFASWCVACAAEHEALAALAEDVAVYGLSYKDRPEDLAAWLERHGNPYRAIGDDREGRVAIDWGVYGVPETFVVDGAGIVRYRHAGAVTPEVYARVLKPLIEELEK
jgi:cytochrome c biogenesis protein CcmG/thiol:disulfide interchange protein DsbE